MSNQIRRSRAAAGEWFYGHEVSDYGKENGYVDYRTLASAFDAVMNNNIMSELENAGFYFDPVQDGSSDYSDEIDDLREAADALRDQATEKTDAADEADEAGDAAEAEKLRAEAAELEAEAEKKGRSRRRPRSRTRPAGNLPVFHRGRRRRGNHPGMDRRPVILLRSAGHVYLGRYALGHKLGLCVDRH